MGGLDCESLAICKQDAAANVVVSEFDVCIELESTTSWRHTLLHASTSSSGGSVGSSVGFCCLLCQIAITQS